jgi:hypothetical protein
MAYDQHTQNMGICCVAGGAFPLFQTGGGFCGFQGSDPIPKAVAESKHDLVCIAIAAGAAMGGIAIGGAGGQFDCDIILMLMGFCLGVSGLRQNDLGAFLDLGSVFAAGRQRKQCGNCQQKCNNFLHKVLTFQISFCILPH